jgi:hypothetical protein
MFGAIRYHIDVVGRIVVLHAIGVARDLSLREGATECRLGHGPMFVAATALDVATSSAAVAQGVGLFLASLRGVGSRPD